MNIGPLSNALAEYFLPRLNHWRAFDQGSQAERERRKPIEVFLLMHQACSCNYEQFLVLWAQTFLLGKRKWTEMTVFSFWGWESYQLYCVAERNAVSTHIATLPLLFDWVFPSEFSEKKDSRCVKIRICDKCYPDTELAYSSWCCFHLQNTWLLSPMLYVHLLSKTYIYEDLLFCCNCTCSQG